MISIIKFIYLLFTSSFALPLLKILDCVAPNFILFNFLQVVEIHIADCPVNEFNTIGMIIAEK